MPRYGLGYNEARERVRKQSLEEDEALIDSLFGFENLRYKATPDEVKREALIQLERDWRIPEEAWRKGLDNFPHESYSEEYV